MVSVCVQDGLSFALRSCLVNVHFALKECKKTNTCIPGYIFLFDSLRPIYRDHLSPTSKLALFVSPIRQRLPLNTQQGKDHFIQVHGPPQAEITEVTVWLARGAPEWRGEYQSVVNIFLRFLGLNPRDHALALAWTLKLDLYCLKFQPCAVVQRGLQLLWRLCGGKEAFGAPVYSIQYPAQANPYTDHTMRAIFRSFGPADTIMEFTDVDRRGPLTMPTYHNEVFTSPLERLPDRHTAYLPGEKDERRRKRKKDSD